MSLNNLTLISLFAYLVSMAATQTVYGNGLESVRWVSLIAFAAFGMLSYLSNGQRVPKGSMVIPVAIYLFLWGLTVLYGKFPEYSGFRFIAHALIVISSLVFLPQVVNFKNSSWLPVTLKIILALAMIVSYVRPAHRTVFDTSNTIRGIFGNASSFGHMCAVGSLLFLHGYLASKNNFWRFAQLILMVLSLLLMIQSGARSSAIALMGGVITLSIYYWRQFSRNLLAVWGLGSVLLFIVIIFHPKIDAYIYKHEEFHQISDPIDRFSASRMPILIASWEAFKERPIFGWGFGVDKDTEIDNWNGQFTSLGFTTRDPVNDLTYTLETGGIVGAFAYFYLISFILRFRIAKSRILPLRDRMNPSEYQVVESTLETQQLFMCLTVLLVVMFEFDGTALSAGYFFAPLLWVSLGIGASLHSLLQYELPLRLSSAYIADNRMAISNS